MEQDLKNVHASSKDTVCIDLCTGNDACVLTTIHSILGKAGIPLVGGTGMAEKSLSTERSMKMQTSMPS